MLDFEDKLCRECVNFIQIKETEVNCEFEYFTSIEINKAQTFLPILFDCIEYELKEK